jgi:hypothetical protein
MWTTLLALTGAKLSQVRTAINAMSSNGHKPFAAQGEEAAGKEVEHGASCGNHGGMGGEKEAAHDVAAVCSK